ncbi:hypothetical protein HF078_06820 [Bacillus sp. RO2]|uniref:hypothetical protein n=1 Tax=Bacillus sp. RO2 TaxID=2723913 RepID=UPI00145CBE91|nr:hypothetical protein [Bacillus sp. RO2]NMH72778.1 hypothetical protein [Bacillus sp. RO2]
MKVAEIKSKLTTLGVEFDDKAGKEQLAKLLKENEEKTEEQPVEPKEETDEQPEEKEESVKYVVIHDFKDLEDNNTVYIKGDIFPRRADANPSQERLQKLLSKNNKIGKPLIKEQA